MPVTTSTHVGAHGRGFRAWVHVSSDSVVAPSGYEVIVTWDPGAVCFQKVPDDAVLPKWVDPSRGMAVWLAVDLARACDFELEFACARAFRGTTTVTGMALNARNFDGHKSHADWSASSA